MVPLLKEEANREQIDSLNEIKSKFSPHKNNVFKAKEKIIDVLKTVDTETLKNIKQIAPPPYFEKIAEISVGPKKARTLHATAKMWVQAGEIDWAIVAANKITDSHEKSTALVRIVHNLVNAGKTDQATEIAKNIPATLVKQYIAAHHFIVEKLTQTGEIDQAAALVKSVNEDSEMALMFKATAVEKIAKYSADAGNFQRAIQDANSITYRGSLQDSKSSAITYIAKKLADAGELIQAIALVKSIEAINAQIYAFKALSDHLASGGHFDEALGIAILLPEGFNKNEALGFIAKKLANAKDFNRASEVADNMSTGSEQANALEYIANKLFDDGQTDRATTMANTMPYISYKISILVGFAKNLAKAGKMDQANEIAGNLIHLADDMIVAEEDPFFVMVKVSRLNDIATCLTELGKIEQAETIFNASIEIAKAAGDQDTFYHLVRDLTKVGKIEQATDIANALQDENEKRWSLENIAEYKAKNEADEKNSSHVASH